MADSIYGFISSPFLFLVLAIILAINGLAALASCRTTRKEPIDVYVARHSLIGSAAAPGYFVFRWYLSD